MAKEEYALNNHCPTCGANLKYTPKTRSWKCEFCRVDYTLEDLKKHENASNDKNNVKVSKEEKEKIKKDKKEEKEENKENLVSYKCKSCGAEVICDDQVSATFCIYCRNTVILQSKLSNEFQPDYIIPFKVEKEEAINAFLNLKKGRKFVPNDFTSQSNIEKIRGVYIPFWLYDVKVAGEIDYSATRSRSWTVGNTVYTEVSYYELERDASMEYDKVPVDGSTRFDNDIMNSIEPFHYNDLVEYNHAYLSGFLAEKYDVDSDAAYIDAQKRTMNSTQQTINSSCVGYSTLTTKSNTLKDEIIDKKYALLPVWMVNVKYNGKLHIFAMNGQTGEFIGNIPLDTKKVIFYAIRVFIITAIIVFIMSVIIYKVGV